MRNILPLFLKFTASVAFFYGFSNFIGFIAGFHLKNVDQQIVKIAFVHSVGAFVLGVYLLKLASKREKRRSEE